MHTRTYIDVFVIHVIFHPHVVRPGPFCCSSLFFSDVTNDTDALCGVLLGFFGLVTVLLVQRRWWLFFLFVFLPLLAPLLPFWSSVPPPPLLDHCCTVLYGVSLYFVRWITFFWSFISLSLDHEVRLCFFSLAGIFSVSSIFCPAYADDLRKGLSPGGWWSYSYALTSAIFVFYCPPLLQCLAYSFIYLQVISRKSLRSQCFCAYPVQRSLIFNISNSRITYNSLISSRFLFLYF